jgi:hypothetical protein
VACWKRQEEPPFRGVRAFDVQLLDVGDGAADQGDEQRLPPSLAPVMSSAPPIRPVNGCRMEWP